MSKEKKPKVVPNSDVSLADYTETLADIKRQIEEARIKAITSASTMMVRLYWNVGRKIVEKQENSGWGANVIEKLAKDIQSAFPAFKGFSRANLYALVLSCLRQKSRPLLDKSIPFRFSVFHGGTMLFC